MKYCRNEHPVLSHEHYCTECGDCVRGVDDLRCPMKHRITKSDAFCPECGVGLKTIVAYTAGIEDEDTKATNAIRPWYKKLFDL